MKRPTPEEQRQLVIQWQETGRILEAMRREKLRGKPYDFAEVDALLSLADHYTGPPRLTSGLVQQQRIFMKAAPDWYKRLRGIE
jgi:hypothetical protein